MKNIVKERLAEIKELVEASPGKYSLQYLEDRFDLSPVTIKKFCLENSLVLGGYDKRNTDAIKAYIRANYQKQTAHQLAISLCENIAYIRNLCYRMKIFPKGTKTRKTFNKPKKNFLDCDNMSDPII